jgi:hypothetical protein
MLRLQYANVTTCRPATCSILDPWTECLSSVAHAVRGKGGLPKDHKIPEYDRVLANRVRVESVYLTVPVCSSIRQFYLEI